MDDCFNIMASKNPVQKLRIADIAFIKFGFRRYRPAKPSGETIKDNNVFVRVEKAPNHVAPDVSGTTCYQNCHLITPAVFVRGRFGTN
ncbi:hypothetical protein EMEDMD4_650002 [Sinorhizobium medicae]|uniref:Uncharacterized protein n=1 Tax=Sinorhizobium medicae TaxID=110321 RepID=A0A508X549_9HYPH|nr:hypothetical protein EMEDMD4_650002 [Sinorhizobium medicae]